MKSLFLLTLVAILCAPVLLSYAQSAMAAGLTARDVHIDRPLSNIAVEAFSGGDFIAQRLFPIVGVQRQSDMYWTIDKAAWLRLPQTTLRAPKTSPRRVEFSVSSDAYFAPNYALAGENPFEVLANAEDPLSVRARTARFVVEMLQRDLEQRLANLVTSISNVGSGVALAGAAKWSNYLSSDPVADVTTGHAFVRQQTGVIPNTLLLDFDTYQILRRHPVMLDMYKYTQGGLLNDAELKEVFKVGNLLVSNAIKNAAPDGAAASIVNIWGNNALLCYVNPAAPGLQTVTFGLAFRWTPDGIPAPMQALVYNDPDVGKKVEVTEVGYYQAEKIVAPQLAYAITTTL